LFRADFHDFYDAVRRDGARVDADDADIVFKAAPAHRLCEGHQRRVAGGAGDIAEVVILAAAADIVEDNAVAALLHAGIEQPGHIDIAHDLDFPARPPVIGADLPEIAARNGARVIDEDVDIARRLMHALDVAAPGEISGKIIGRDAVRLFQPLGNLLQPVLLPRDEEEIGAFFGEHFRQPLPDPLRGAGDQHAFTFKSQIHYPILT